jgi:hypothetical protein
VNHLPVWTREALRRIAALVGAILIGAAASAMATTPAYSAADAPVGYVRLAHLSPDTPMVDVYLSKVGDPTFKEQIFTHVGYGVVSKYMALPVGTYAVAMRKQGDPASTPPVLTTQVTVTAGGAYTVAGVGKSSGLGLKVLTDDLSRPTNGKAKVRVIQASVGAPVLDVFLPNGEPIATAISFASTTPYQLVSPGTLMLRLKPNGSSTVTAVTANLVAGSVYSLLVLDGPDGLKLEMRVDAHGGGSVPDGGVETGAGGDSDAASGGARTDNTTPLTMTAVGVAALAGLLVVALRLRRVAASRRP